MLWKKFENGFLQEYSTEKWKQKVKKESLYQQISKNIAKQEYSSISMKELQENMNLLQISLENQFGMRNRSSSSSMDVVVENPTPKLENKLSSDSIGSDILSTYDKAVESMDRVK